MKKEDCYNFINNNSSILVISLQCFYTDHIIKNNYQINDSLTLPPFCLERQTGNYKLDFLLIRDPYTIYYLGGYNLDDNKNNYTNFISIIKEHIVKKYKKIIIIGLSSAAYAGLLFILNSDLSNIIHEAYLCSPQIDIFTKKNTYLCHATDKQARLKLLTSLVPRKYSSFKFFNLSKKLNSYTGSCKLFIYYHKQNNIDFNNIKNIKRNIKNVTITELNDAVAKSKETHNTLAIIYKKVFDSLINKK